jgi:predicted nucleic acid-binding Zn finger protein
MRINLFLINLLMLLIPHTSSYILNEDFLSRPGICSVTLKGKRTQFILRIKFNLL